MPNAYHRPTPAGGDLTSRNANTRPLTFLRALGCLDSGLRLVRTGGCRGFQPALADGIAYHPHSTRNPPDQPFATADNADLASLSRIEHLLDLMQRWGRIGQHGAAGDLVGRVRLPDQPAGQAARRLAGAPGPLPPAGRLPRVARSARTAHLAVPVGRREGRRRQSLHGLAVGPALRRRASPSPRWRTSRIRSGSTSRAARCGARCGRAGPTPSRSRCACRARRRPGSRSPR